jgi:hypothetical protein
MVKMVRVKVRLIDNGKTGLKIPEIRLTLV